MKKYKVVQNPINQIEAFETSCNFKLNDGWKPLGGAFIAEGFIHQSFYKKSK